MNELQTFIGRQPIVDREGRTAAYELLYRASGTSRSARFEDYDHAATRVVVNTFVSLGVEAVLGPWRGFLNIPPGILRSDVIEALPADRVVLEILESVVPDAPVVERCRELKECGFEIALDDWVLDDPRQPLLEVADLVKVDLPQVPRSKLRGLLRGLRRHGVVTLAEKVEGADQFAYCHKLGFDLFQGYYFAEPTILSGRGVDPERLGLLDLLQRLSGGAETGEIADALKTHPAVALNLLRVVNSAAHGRAEKISRVEDAIVFLGRSQVRRWVAILLFAGDGPGGCQGPLLVAAAHRGRLMELLARRVSEGSEAGLSDRAFLVGLLSLIDALLGAPMEEIVRGLGLEEAAEAALLGEPGLLGDLLALARDAERARFDSLERRLEGLGIPQPVFQQDEHAAYQWIHRLISELAADVAA